MFGLLKQPKRPPNIAVYYISTIIDGNALTSPIGVMPRFSDEYERAIREKHRPQGQAFIDDQVGDVAVILSWTAHGTIDAVCFLSEKAARAFPGFVEFRDNTLDPILRHFPRHRAA